MTNYFYFDANGEEQGPISAEQVSELVTQGIIEPEWPLETEDGHTFEAGQIAGVFDNPPAPAPQKAATSWLSWLFDFEFRDIRIQIIHLWTCRILYVICWISAIIGGIWVTLGLCQAVTNFKTAIPILCIPLVWIGIAVMLFVTRLYLELYLIVIDWIVETTKAARLYIENNKRE